MASKAKRGGGDRPVAAEGASPIEAVDRRWVDTFTTAAIWLTVAGALFAAWQVATAILILVAGLVFGVALDAGARLLGRVMKASHGVRLAIVCVLIILFVGAAAVWIGGSIADQAETMWATLTVQYERLALWLGSLGISVDADSVQSVIVEGVRSGGLTSFIGSIVGAVTGLVLIIVFGVYIAAEPKLYARGLAWLTPRRHRVGMEVLFEHLGHTMRRWVAGRLAAMTIDGLLSGIGLALVGVPLAGLLGLLSFLLAFIPNIGAAIAGVLMVTIGLSAGTTTGLAAFAVYVVVQFVEANLLTPYIERRVVDLAPAVVLGVQLLFGALFGIMGLAMADPIVAMARVVLEHRGAKADPKEP
jgi:predicted PurR-regulated permease PerM